MKDENLDGWDINEHGSLAHRGFTDEELDFIPSTRLRAGNYEIKYRMGRDAESEED